MAKWYLMRAATVQTSSGPVTYLPGRLFDDAVQDISQLQSAGALFWPATDATVASNAARAAIAHANGADASAMEGIMRDGVDGSVDLLTTMLFGEGNDGVAVFDGTNAFAAFASKSSSTYTLTRDVFLSSMTVAAGVEVKTAGFKLFVSGTATIAVGGVVSCNGNDASGATAGAASALGTLGIGTAGGNGRAGVGTGTAGTNQTNTLGDSSAAGGAGGAGGAQAGGAAGTYTPNAINGGANFLTPMLTGFLFTQTSGGNQAQAGIIGGGSGGGGGGADNAGATGGGGGGGAGVLALHARTLVNNGTIRARGGAGAAGTGSAGNAGGGGGGGGGIVLQLSRYRSGTGTVDVSGGAGGAAFGGSGVAGTAGSAGHVNAP